MWAWKYENKIPQKIFNLMPKNYQDALSTYLFGGVCTGRANLGTALFRANGIPAKDLAVMPTWLDFKYDMHFISQYYCPGYGWVFVETSYGIQKTPCEPKYNIVMRVNYPDDENKAGNYSTGISGNGGVEQFRWIDKTFVYFSHLSSVNSAQIEKELTTSQNLADTAFQLTQNVYEMYTKYFGVNLIGENQQHVVNATLAQKNAITCFNQSDIQGYIDDMTIAYIEYMEIA